MKSCAVIKDKSLVLERVCDELKNLVKDHPKFANTELCELNKTVLVVVNKNRNIFPEKILQKFERIQRCKNFNSDQITVNASASIPKNSLKSSFKIPKVAKVNNDCSSSGSPADVANVCEDTFEDIDADYEQNDILLENENSPTSISESATRQNNEEDENNENENENEQNDSDCDETKSEDSCSKGNVSEYQKMINDDEVLDFEENDDDEDDGNFKRRKKIEKEATVWKPKAGQPVNPIINVPASITATKAPVSVPKTIAEKKPSVPAISVETRNTLNFGNRVDNKYRGNSDMPLDNILKQMQKPDPIRIREKEVAIEDINHALNVEGTEEAFRLYCNKINFFDPKERNFQHLLEKIALRAVKVQRFSRIHQLRKKLEEARIVSSEFWNKFITEGVNQIRSVKDMQIRTMLQETYDYLLRNDVNITVKSTQHLLEIVAPRNEKPDYKHQTDINTVKSTANSITNSKIIRLSSSNSTCRSNIPSRLSVKTSSIPESYSNISQLHTHFPFQGVSEPVVSKISPMPLITPFQNINQTTTTQPQFTLPTVFQKFEEPLTPNIPASVLAKCPFQGFSEPVLFRSEDVELDTPPEIDPVITSYTNPDTKDDSKVSETSADKTVSLAPSSTEPIPFKCLEASKFFNIHKPSYCKPENIGRLTLTEGPSVKIEWQCPDAEIPDPRITYKKSNNDSKETSSNEINEENKDTSVEVAKEKQTVTLKTVELNPKAKRVKIVKTVGKTKKKLKIGRNLTNRSDDITNVTIRVGEAIPAIQIIKNYNSQNSTRIVKPVKRKLVNTGTSKVVKRIKAVVATD